MYSNGTIIIEKTGSLDWEGVVGRIHKAII